MSKPLMQWYPIMTELDDEPLAQAILAAAPFYGGGNSEVIRELCWRLLKAAPEAEMEHD